MEQSKKTTKPQKCVFHDLISNIHESGRTARLRTKLVFAIVYSPMVRIINKLGKD